MKQSLTYQNYYKPIKQSFVFWLLIVQPIWGLAQPRTPNLEAQVMAICQAVADQEKLLTYLSADAILNYPLGVTREISGVNYVIAVDSVRGSENGYLFNAYTTIQFPGTARPLAFVGQNLQFGEGGIAQSSDTRLVLASHRKIPINEHIDLVLPADGHNYVEFDCEGFRSINLKGHFVFRSELLIPDPGWAASANEVIATFEVNTADIHNILASVSITPFQIRGLGGISFRVTNAVVDMSDFENPVGLVFPQEYRQIYGTNVELWRGFYLQEIENWPARRTDQ
ncbi:MAG: hypothetical protein HC880_03930 [Bacteroidia bacterium]|nr:hypothetical protein [Bacteroidia bacterium]